MSLLPVILPSAISGGLGLIGSLFSSISAKEMSSNNYDATIATNNANKEIAQQTNDTQMAIHQADNAFNAQQADLAWQRQQQAIADERLYNSLASQMHRAMSAGVNPSAVIGNIGSSGAASIGSSAASASSSPQLHTPTLQAPRYDYVDRSFETMASLANSFGDFVGKAIDNTEKQDTLKARISMIQDEARKMHADADLQQTLAKLKAITFDNDVEAAELQNQNLAFTGQVLQEQAARFRAQTWVDKQQVAIQHMQLGQKQQEFEFLLEKHLNELALAYDQLNSQREIAFMNDRTNNRAISESARQFDAEEKRLAQEFRSNYLSDLHRLRLSDKQMQMAEELLPYQKGQAIGVGIGGFLHGLGQTLGTIGDIRHPNRGRLRSQRRTISTGSSDIQYEYW